MCWTNRSIFRSAGCLRQPGSDVNFGLLFPLALTALAATIVPLVIHIARKSEQRPVDFAALRWLRERPRPRSRLRFDEWPLLLIRLLLVALVALLLAAPMVLKPTGRHPYTAIVPGAQLHAAPPANAHWVATGFPGIDTPAPRGEQPTASLIRQLDADLPRDTPLTIIVPRMLAGADADTLRLSRKVTWRIVDGAAPYRKPAAPSRLRLAIRHDDHHASDLRYLRAVALAWQGGPPDIAGLQSSLPQHDVALAWLGSGTLPAHLEKWVAQGGTALIPEDAALPGKPPFAILWRTERGEPMAHIAAFGKGRLIRLARQLAPSTAPELLDADFPSIVENWVRPTVPVPGRVLAADYRPSLASVTYDPSPIDLRPWLALCIALLFAAERWLATRRNRSIAP